MLDTNEKPLEEEIQTNEPEEKAPEVTEEVKPETTPEVINDDGGEMELLSDLKKATDKDIDKTTQTVTDASGNTQTVVTTEIIKRTNISYQNHELVAQLTVAALNVAMGLILQMIADDWTEEAEKKYTLSPTRKKEILEPLALVLEQSKSKYNPVVILVITVLVAYVPMFINAFRARKEKQKIAKFKKKYVNNEGQNTDFEIDEKARLKEELNSFHKAAEITPKVVTQKVEIFKMTKGQLDRLKKIKAKRGRRSESDQQFLKEMNLDGLI